MNEIAQKILLLVEKYDQLPLKLREIGRMIGVDHPQKVKYHLQKLYDQKLITINEDEGFIERVLQDPRQTSLFSLPVYGSADCGPATQFADDMVTGEIKVSERLLFGRAQDQVVVVQASGDSMDQCSISGSSINDGDYVLVDVSPFFPNNGDYVVSTIEGCANIKKFFMDTQNQQVHLISESSQNYPPIILDAADNLQVLGKVFGVIPTSS